MSHVFTVIILVAILIPLVAFLVGAVWGYSSGTSCSGIAGYAALATFPVVVLVVILLIFSRTEPVQLTA